MTRRTISAILFTGAALLATACADTTRDQLAPSTPSMAAGLLARSSKPVERGTPVRQDLTRSVTVTNSGGTLEIPEVGLKVSIPSNALPAGQTSLTISVTAFAGNQYAYEFAPSGTQFRRPLKFEQQLDDASLRDLLAHLLNPPVVAYFKSRQDINPLTGVVVTLENLLTSLDLSGRSVKADLWHFSGYVVAWGRS
jgi:hypothetical protein